ncbi:carboxymuconolactone decarboxylase family protein [Streptomyces sp. NPDC005065]|uniref:carboxymuconolactone decarboxylase family protein n=1 Tax=Streptomyces sp. NPDC005065 TaxID=3154461 RepID=UPI0033AE2D9F
MSRIPLIQPDAATPAAAELLADVKKAWGVTPNMTKAMVNSPAVLKAYLAFSGALSGGDLRPAVRERIALLTAQENGCDYCLASHIQVATHVVKLDQSEVEQARQAKSEDPHADAALSLAAAVLRSRGGITDGDVDAARTAGLSDAEIAEVIAEVSLSTFTNYFNKAVATDLDGPLARYLP